jgi:hypothetical protein
MELIAVSSATPLHGTDFRDDATEVDVPQTGGARP